MVLLILSKGAQRRKSGEKRKDRKKEATEEEEGCPEEETLVSAACSWTAVRAVLPSQRFVNGSPSSRADPCLRGPWTLGEQRSAIAVATLALPFVLTETLLVC